MQLTKNQSNACHIISIAFSSAILYWSTKKLVEMVKSTPDPLNQEQAQLEQEQAQLEPTQQAEV